jgi:hypothetical protein
MLAISYHRSKLSEHCRLQLEKPVSVNIKNPLTRMVQCEKNMERASVFFFYQQTTKLQSRLFDMNGLGMSRSGKGTESFPCLGAYIPLAARENLLFENNCHQ